MEEGDVSRIENADDDDVTREVEDELEARERQILKDDKTKNSDRGVQITAKVVGIIKRNWRTYPSKPFLCANFEQVRRTH